MYAIKNLIIRKEKLIIHSCICTTFINERERIWHLSKTKKMRVKDPPKNFKKTHKYEIQASKKGFYKDNTRISKKTDKKSKKSFLTKLRNPLIMVGEREVGGINKIRCMWIYLKDKEERNKSKEKSQKG